MMAERTMVRHPALADAGDMDEGRIDCEECGDDAIFRGRLRLHGGRETGPRFTLCQHHYNLALMNGARPLGRYEIFRSGRWCVSL